MSLYEARQDMTQWPRAARPLGLVSSLRTPVLRQNHGFSDLAMHDAFDNGSAMRLPTLLVTRTAKPKPHGVLLPDLASAEISFSAVKRSNRRSGSVITLKRASNFRSRGVNDWMLSKRGFFPCLLARTGAIPPCYFAY